MSASQNMPETIEAAQQRIASLERTVAALRGDVDRFSDMLEETELLTRLSAELARVDDESGLLLVLSAFPFAEDADAIVYAHCHTDSAGQFIETEVRALRGGSGLAVPTVGTRQSAESTPLLASAVASPLRLAHLADGQAADTSEADRAYATGLGARGVAVVALMQGSRWIGVLSLLWRGARPFSATELRLVHALPRLLGPVCAHLRLVADLQGTVSNLNNALLFKDQFLAIMSHELRTPLNAIMGYATIMQQPGTFTTADTSPERLLHMTNRIVANSERLLNLINAILDLSRINAGRIEIVADEFDLHEVAGGWFTDYQKRVAAKGLAFTFSFDDGLPQRVMGDHERLTQIVANLLENAIKFTEQGGIDLTVKREGSLLCVQVHDSGIGISPTWHDLIFDEFRRVEMDSVRKTDGAGLGLSIVQRLVTLMGGAITLESALGVGSTFTVTLPLRPV